MKKNLLVLALILASCSNQNNSKHHFYKKASARGASYNNYSNSNNVKFTYRVRPSEAMAAGLGAPTKFNTIRNENKLPQKYDNVYGDLHEIMNDGQYVGQYKVGNPYEIEGTFYYPQEYEDYEEVGVSSWYGDPFHGKKTANGEIYNSQALTAAHQTLPLPSMARVTNINNGKTVLVRVNDRGPFAKSRIIDVSEKAAEMLGYHDAGTAVVKVEYLPKETKELHLNLNIRKQ